MNCVKATRQLHFYLDQQLTLEEMRQLEMHISSCQSCRHELRLLEEIDATLKDFVLISEPVEFAANVMHRIALTEREKKIALLVEPPEPVSWHFSFRELLLAIVLATCVTGALILFQPELRAVFPMMDGHGGVLLIVANLWEAMLSVNSNTLMLCFWVLGTVLGIWITLFVAGAEMRSQWYRAMIDRLPVW